MAKTAMDIALKQSRNQYLNSKGMLLHRPWVVKCRSKGDSASVIWFFVVLAVVACFPVYMVSMMLMVGKGILLNPFLAIPINEDEQGVVTVMIGICVLVYMFSAVMLILYDMDVLECYRKGYKYSTYYRATGVNKNMIHMDRGLIGEFRGYVLSRKLKVPHKVLFNVCVPMPNGNYQEVDCIIITNNLIYVIECKNRAGVFVGSYTDKRWVQHIGSQQHECENIYLQNQKHTMAIDSFLLHKGIIDNGDNVCMNVLLTSGDMKLPHENIPLDFKCDNLKNVANYINMCDKNYDDGTDTSGLMLEVYYALLPYALYTEQERKLMLQERAARSEAKQLVVGDFKMATIPNGINGITEPGETAYIRWNRCYTQLYISDGNQGCWQTRTDIPSSYKN